MHACMQTVTELVNFISKEISENVKNNCNAKIVVVNVVVVVVGGVVVAIGVLNYNSVKPTLRIVCESPDK